MSLVIDNHAASAAVYCGGICLVFSWLIAFTIVLSLVLSGSYNDLNQTIETHDSDQQRLCDLVDEKTESAENAVEKIEGELPCLEDLHFPAIFDRIVEAYRCLGCWDANRNRPTLSSSNGNQGDLYVVCVAGSTTLNNISSWAVNNLILYVDDETRWAKVGSAEKNMEDNGTHVSLITQGVGNALETATIVGANGFVVARSGDVLQVGAVLATVPSLVRDYNRAPFNGVLNGTTGVSASTNSVLLSLPGAEAPVVVREYWTRSGDILEGFVTVAFKPLANGTATVTLASWPSEIVDEFGGFGNTSTVTRNTVSCSMVLTNADESITPSPNGTVISDNNDVVDNGCFVNPPPGAPGLAQDTSVQLFVEYGDIPVSSVGVDAYNHQLWRLTFTSLASF